MNRRERRAAASGGNRSANPPAAHATHAQSHLAALLARAVQHYQAGRFREASRLCQQILGFDPENLAALQLHGFAALQFGRNEAAVDTLSKALKLNDQIPDLHSGIAEALQRLDRFEEAISHYRCALALDPGYVEVLYNFGNVLLKLKRYEEAIANFDRALAMAPGFAEALHNRGSAAFELGRYESALADYDRALAIEPDFVIALANRGAALVALKRLEEGLASCDRALALDPADVTALAHRGNALFELRRFADAAEDFERLLTIDPDYPYAVGRALYFRLLHCDWTNYERTLAKVASQVAAGKRAVPPFMFLNMSDSASARMQCAQIFSQDRYPASSRPVWRGERYDHAKIRVAYLSADFRHHPMAYLMAGLFEAHDRTCFETTAISFGPDPKDEFRKRLENSFDRFVDVQNKNDRDIALLVKELEI